MTNVPTGFINPDAASLNEHGPSTHQSLQAVQQQANREYVNAETAAPQAAVAVDEQRRNMALEMASAYKQAVEDARFGAGSLPPYKAAVQEMGPERAERVMRLIYPMAG